MICFARAVQRVLPSPREAGGGGGGGGGYKIAPPRAPRAPTLPTTRFARGGRGACESLRSDIQESIAQDSLSPSRPLRLFTRPEPVEAIAEVPDGPPVRFRWRQVMHQVARSEGPERIAMEWWRDDRGNKLTRDYFRVESQIGVRVWLYREGLYGHEVEPPAQPKWYLHGLFA